MTPARFPGTVSGSADSSIWAVAGKSFGGEAAWMRQFPPSKMNRHRKDFTVFTESVTVHFSIANVNF